MSQSNPTPAIKERWWQRGVIYEVYPRSFQDSDGDGVGDLRGLIGRLEYLAWLGVDAIWVAPFFPSPMADFGYDVMDYTGVDPLFGTLDDADRLIAAAHRHGLKVIFDYVPNHSSDQHPWFRDSRASRQSSRRDWYIWRDPAPGGGPPNNWLSVFGGSAWTRDDATGQYYYHAYLAAQPDLNWRNPDVQRAMLDAMRFWLDRGVDGFRIDALRQLVEDADLRDNPPNPDYRPGQSAYHRLTPQHTTDQPETRRLTVRMRGVSDEYDDRVLIGELYLPIPQLVAYYGSEHGQGLQLPFNFHLLMTDWRADAIADLIRRYEAALPPDGWPNWVLGNHDQPRLASRVGAAQARVAALLLLTLRGTPTLYYGDELGMPSVAIPPDRIQDPAARGGPHQGRDPERTPMLWDGGDHAGFTDGQPWLPLGAGFGQMSVAAQRGDPDSLLSLYARAIALRRSARALAAGAYGRIEARGALLAYERAGAGRRFLVILNLGAERQSYSLAADERGRVRVATSRAREGEPAAGQVALAADEGLVIELAA